MNELDRNTALCTCLEAEEIRGKSQKKNENKISIFGLEKTIHG